MLIGPKWGKSWYRYELPPLKQRWLRLIWLCFLSGKMFYALIMWKLTLWVSSTCPLQFGDRACSPDGEAHYYLVSMLFEWTLCLRPSISETRLWIFRDTFWDWNGWDLSLKNQAAHSSQCSEALRILFLATIIRGFCSGFDRQADKGVSWSPGNTVKLCAICSLGNFNPKLQL